MIIFFLCLFFFFAFLTHSFNIIFECHVCPKHYPEGRNESNYDYQSSYQFTACWKSFQSYHQNAM